MYTEFTSALFSHQMSPDKFISMRNIGSTKEWIETSNYIKEHPKFILVRPSGETIEYDASSIINKINYALSS